MMRFLAENRMAVRVGSTVVLGVSVFVYAFLFLLLATVGPREPNTTLGTITPLGGTTRTATVTKTATPQRSPTPFSTLGPTPGQFGGVNNGNNGGTGPVILPPTRVIPVDTVAPTFTQDIRDDDQDGILNVNDNCSNDSGPASNGGCPIDSDGDGLLDNQDNCAFQAGPAWNSGCAVPLDTDGDSIPDKDDKCKDQAGTTAYQGCPNPDADGDSFNDVDADACPGEFGTINGCPDSDGDTFPEGSGGNDACPNLTGTINGCPDSDNDGIPEGPGQLDACPGVDGKGSANGCPVEPAAPAGDGARIPTNSDSQLDVLWRGLRGA